MAILLVLAIFLDRLSKTLIGVQANYSQPIFGEIFFLEHALNAQGPLGIVVPSGILLWGGVVAMFGLAILIYYTSENFRRLLLLSVLAGVLSNTYDRLVDGYVVDVFKISPGIIFNIADIMILVGVVVLVSIMIYETRR